jgi:hypothetical protein
LDANLSLCSERPVTILLSHGMANLLTNSVAQEPEGHHRTHNSPPPVPVLSQSNPIHTPQANLLKIHSDPIFPPTSRSSKWSLSFGLSHQNLVRFSLLSHAYHMPRPPHSP